MPRIPTSASWLQVESFSAQWLKGHRLSESRFKDHAVSANWFKGLMRANTPKNALKDFEPISLVATIEWGIVVADQLVHVPYKGATPAAVAAAAGQVEVS